MRWTRACLQTNGTSAYGKSVWSWHPWAGVKPLQGRDVGPTGPDGLFGETTVTTRSWTPGRARHKRSNHRAGNVDVSASSAATTLVCFSHLAHEAETATVARFAKEG